MTCKTLVRHQIKQCIAWKLHVVTARSGMMDAAACAVAAGEAANPVETERKLEILQACCQLLPDGDPDVYMKLKSLITHHSIPLDSQGVLPPSSLRCAVCWCRGGSTSAAARPAAAADAAQQWMEVVEAAATAATSAAGASNGSGPTN